MRRLEAEFFENDGVGTALLDFGKPERIEKHVAQLLRGTDVEFHTRHVADFFLEILDAAGQFLFQRLECGNINRHTYGFHLVQYLQQRHFLLEEILHVVKFFEFLLERLPKAERVDCIFGAVFGGFLDGRAVERNLVFAASDEILDGNHLVLQTLHHLIVEPEAGLPRRKHPGGNQRIDDVCVVDNGLRNLESTCENMQVEFRVVEHECSF